MLFWRHLILFLALTLGLPFNPSLAGNTDSHFAKIALDSAPEDRVTNKVMGETGGSFSLTSLSQYDDQGNLCSGYSYDNVPHHILELSQPIEELSIWVNSKQNDTTLLIRGENSLDCADDLSEINPDAGVIRNNWTAGVYQIWVGSSAPEQRLSYQLEVQRGVLPTD